MEESQGLPWRWGQWGAPAPQGQVGVAPKQWVWGLKVAPAGTPGFPHVWGEMSSLQPRVSPQRRDPKDPPMWVQPPGWVGTAPTASVDNDVCLGEA